MVGTQRTNGGGASLLPSQPAKMYGITKPISVAGPTEADLHRNAELEKVTYIEFTFMLVY